MDIITILYIIGAGIGFPTILSGITVFLVKRELARRDKEKEAFEAERKRQEKES